MSRAFDRFWWGTTIQMRIGFLGFVVAAIGVMLGFAINYGPGNPMAYIAYGVVVAGVAIGFSGVIWGIYAFLTGWDKHEKTRL